MRLICIILFSCLFFSSAGVVADYDYNQVGLNAHIPPADVIEACADVGAKWIRVDNNWFQNQPDDAPADFITPLDFAVTTAISLGLNVYMEIAYTPPWASSGGVDATTGNDVPVRGTYYNYVRQTVAHYRPMGVTHYGLWNEPNLEQFWEGSPDEYVARIVVEGIGGIRDGCSDSGYDDCLVLGPDLAHIGDYDLWLEDILRAMDAEGVSFDIYTHHIYQGFPETGVYLWDGDRFFNALDQRRFSFTRRSFIDTLTDCGHASGGVPDRQVWITETGYRCSPPMDSSEQHMQSVYYMRVLDEQVVRPWYTVSFFYEIIDSEDDLDGFGIIRRSSEVDDSWRDNFEFKEAYYSLKERIENDPAFGEIPCSAQCCDGVDNDSDTLIDMADDGCSFPEDDDESDEFAPGAPVVYARRTGGIGIDGMVDDWFDEDFIELVSPDDFVSLSAPPPSDEGDIGARFSLMWDEQNIYIAVIVTDDIHRWKEPADELWMGDSVQVAFDMGLNGGRGYDSTDDYEFGWAVTDDRMVFYRWQAPAGSSEPSGIVAQGRRDNEAHLTIYEVKIPAGELGVDELSSGMRVGFTILVNEADGEQREGWLEWSPGIGAFKNPDSFGIVEFSGGDEAGDDVGSAIDEFYEGEGGALLEMENHGYDEGYDASVQESAEPTGERRGCSCCFAR